MKQRIFTAVIALLIFIPVIVYGKLPFVILIFLMGTIGLRELLRTSKLTVFIIPSLLSFLFLWLVLLKAQDYIVPNISYNLLKIVIGLMMMLLAYTVLSKNRFTFSHAGTLLLGTIYLSVGFYFFIFIREVGLQYLLFILIVIWTTDTGAYFSGRYFGNRKLWPSISPNKTIEGAIGGLILSVIVGMIFHLIYPFELSILMIIAYAFVISIVGQVGDLVASALKRHFEVKDFGNILPGHGGILDRFDSLLFVLPILYILQFM